MARGRRSPLIVIEAIDAGGSQTQTDLLVRHLKRAGYQPVALHFPQADRATGQIIYRKFLHARLPDFSRREQALLYIQDFFSRVEDIQRWRSRGHTVIVADRYCTSTMAYQTVGMNRRARRRLMTWITRLCYQGTPSLPRPDLVIFIDTPVAIAVAHLAGRRRDYFEHQRRLISIRASYLALARERTWPIVPGVDDRGRQRPRRAIHTDVWSLVTPRLSS